MQKFMEFFPKTPIISFDAGYMFDDFSPAGQLKNKLIIEVMNNTSTKAANVADPDLKDGYEAFAQSVRGAEFPLLSSSFRYLDDLSPVFRPATVIEEDGYRIGIIGINRMAADFQTPGPQGRVFGLVEPLSAVEQALAGIRGNCDLIVVLAYCDLETARAVKAAFPEIDYLLASFEEVLLPPISPDGNAPIQYCADKGRYVLETRLVFGENKKTRLRRTFIHYLTSEYPVNRQVVEAVSSVENQLEAAQQALEEAGAQQRTAPSTRGQPYAGARSCEPCHQKEYRIWVESKHAVAYRSLPGDQRTSPQCLRCHVTGHGNAAGFGGIASEAELENVQCESCHHAGAKHADDPRGQRLRHVSPWVCKVCHDAENSPEFDYERYWDRIKH